VSLKKELLDLLVTLPEVDTVDKRKAFVSLVGFASLGIYLDWEGANVVFFPRLVDELSRRGQPNMLQFLNNLQHAPQAADVERKEQAVRLAAEVQNLHRAAWEQEFAVTSVIAPARKPDLDMLTLAAISTVLVPYLKAVDTAGRPAAAALTTRIEQAFTADPTASLLWGPFKENPELFQAALVPILKDKIGKEAGLVTDLENLIAPAVKEQTSRPAVSIGAGLQINNSEVGCVTGVRGQVPAGGVDILNHAAITNTKMGDITGVENAPPNPRGLKT
jgi:hypothetical protein